MTRPLFDIFDAVPGDYDLINRVFTWGLDRRWRKAATKRCLESHPEKILDLCSGTGDLAFALSAGSDQDQTVIALDFSRNMLEVARKKTASLEKPPLFAIGDAANLPFPDKSLDCIGISFAFRNLTYKNPHARQHLAEIVRILKPGGKFVIIESSQPKSGIIRKLNHIYLRVFVSMIGGIISGNRPAYKYLAESAARYYSVPEIKKLLIDAGFTSVESKPFLFGAVALHVAVK